MYYYIVNPTSGNGKINKIQDRLKGKLSELGIAGEFVKSTGPDDIPKLTEIGVKKGYNTIIAIGGDKTANEVLNNIPGDKVAFGIIPLGDTNVLANSLGIFDWLDACQILAARKTIKVNVGEVYCDGVSKFFINKLVIGAEAEIKKNNPEIPQKIGSRLKHSAKILKTLKNYKPHQIHFEINKSLKGNAQAVNIRISNVSLEENNHSFKLLIQETFPQKEKISFLMSGDISTMTEGHENTIIFGDHITIKANSVSVAADDQYIGVTPVEIKISNRKIRIIVGSIKAYSLVK